MMHCWLSPLTRPRSVRNTAPVQFRPQVEALERRDVPAALADSPTLAFEQAFLDQAVRYNLVGFQMANFAASRAATAAVRQYAQTSAAGHAQALGQLLPLIQEAGVAMPTIGAAEVQALRRLALQPGRFFDMTYLQISATVSVGTVALYSTATAPGSASEPTMTFVSGALPPVSQTLASSASMLGSGSFGLGTQGFLRQLSTTAYQVLAMLSANHPPPSNSTDTSTAAAA